MHTPGDDEDDDPRSPAEDRESADHDDGSAADADSPPGRSSRDATDGNQGGGEDAGIAESRESRDSPGARENDGIGGVGGVGGVGEVDGIGGASGDDERDATVGDAPTGTRPEADEPGRATDSRDRATGRSNHPAVRTFAYDVVSSALAVLIVGFLLFAVSGVWPPMVAVESPSMTPNMHTGDLVFVMEADRFPGDGAHETGVVTARTGRTTDADYRRFGHQGDVIVYRPDGQGDATPIIHRAMFWVDEGENWYEEADRQALGRYSECGDSPGVGLPNCPAPHAGFVTKGDANGIYDQAQGLSGPVRPAWIVGTAEVRIPLLGCIRLRSERCANGILGQSGTPLRSPNSPLATSDPSPVTSNPSLVTSNAPVVSSSSQFDT